MVESLLHTIQDILKGIVGVLNVACRTRGLVQGLVRCVGGQGTGLSDRKSWSNTSRNLKYINKQYSGVNKTYRSFLLRVIS